MYECEEGYLPPANMSGNITKSHTCTSDGTWSDNVTIECRELNMIFFVYMMMYIGLYWAHSTCAQCKIEFSLVIENIIARM